MENRASCPSAASAQKATPANWLFPLGQVLITPGALALLKRTKTDAFDLLDRHQRGDWGSVPLEDAEANESALYREERLLSSYFVNERERVWIISEADRCSTTLLLPEEY